MWETERGMQREERWEKIKGSKSNRWYQWIKGEEEVPGYLKKGWGESRWQRIAKFRRRNKGRKILGGRGEKEV